MLLPAPGTRPTLSPHDACCTDSQLPLVPLLPQAPALPRLICMGGRDGGPTNPAFCLVLKAQLSQALEELGSQKQRADMVSPGHALQGLCAQGRPREFLSPRDVSCRPVWAPGATSLLVTETRWEQKGHEV